MLILIPTTVASGYQWGVPTGYHPAIITHRSHSKPTVLANRRVSYESEDAAAQIAINAVNAVADGVTTTLVEFRP